MPYRRPARAQARTRARAALLLALLLVLAACGESDGGGRAMLDGDWILAEGQGPRGAVPLTDEGDEPIAVTLSIDGSDWGGTVCNHYGGQAELRGGEVRIRQLFATEMACLDRQLMEAEARYHAALQDVASYEVDGDQLVLAGPASRLVFDRVAPAEPAALAGTTWTLDTLIDGEVASSVQAAATLRLDPAGTFEAGDGCNRFDGDYEVADDRLRATITSTTDAACPPPLARQADHIHGVLTAEPAITVEGDRLTLTAGRFGLVYRADDA